MNLLLCSGFSLLHSILASLYLHQMQKYPDGGCLPGAFINHHRSSRSRSDDIIPRASILAR